MKARLLTFLVIISLVACDKRYEDGPAISFIKPENRLSGQWLFETRLLNDHDDLSQSVVDTLKTYRFLIFKSLNGAMFFQVTDSADLVLAETLIRYDDRVTELTFKLFTITGYEMQMAPVGRYIGPLLTERTWYITRLKKDELWMKTEYDGDIYELRFKLGIDYPNL